MTSDKTRSRGSSARSARLIRYAVILGTAFVFLACMGSCAGSNQSRDPVRIMFTITSTNDTFRLLLTDSMKKEAALLGVELDVRYAAGSLDSQVDAVLAADREGFDAVICFPVDAGDVLEIEEAAGDMPVVFVNNKPADAVLSHDHYMYVGCRETDAGRMQAEYVWNRLGRPHSFQAALLMGEPGHSGAMGRSSAVKAFFEENNVDVDWVFEDYANWSVEDAREKFTTLLDRGVKFDAVFANNDLMALGAVSVMNERGLSTSRIPVTGVDAIPAGCQSIKNSGICFTVYQNPDKEGGTAVRLAKWLVEGSEGSFEGLDESGLCVWIPYEPVDKNNVDNYITEDSADNEAAEGRSEDSSEDTENVNANGNIEDED